MRRPNATAAPCIVQVAREHMGMVVNIPSSKLKQLVKLSQRKEALLAQIQDIDRDMLRLEREFRRAAGRNITGRITFSAGSRKSRNARRSAPPVSRKRSRRA
jgi:hypothetical protein